MRSLSKKTILTLSVAFALTGCNEAETNLVDKSPRPVNVMEIGASNGFYQQYFAGRLESVDQANVSFRVPGTIEEIYVSPGDVVQKGQKLAQVDPHDYQVALMELQARLTEAESSHRLAESELRRVKQAIADNAIASVNLDRAKSGYERSQAAIDVVQQNIKKAEDAIRYTTLLAPFDGVVGEQNAEEFEQVLPGIAVFKVHKPSKLEAVVDVPESLIQQFDYGQAAKIFWHDKTEKLAAVAKEIGTVPHPIKQTYEVVFTLTEMDESALPGKAVVVEAEFANAKGIYCLPYSTVLKHDDKHSVYIVEDQKAVPKPVEVTNLLGNEICVSGPLNPGDIIITSGVGYLKANQEVGELIMASAK